MNTAEKPNILGIALKRGGAIFVVVSALVVPAADFAASTWSLLARFLVILSVFVVSILSLSKRPLRSERIWLGAGLSFLVAAMLCIILYSYLRSTWLVRFEDTTVVSGTPYFTDATRDWLAAQSPRLTRDDQIVNRFTSAGIQEIWKPDVVNFRTASLIAVYIATIELFALALLCIIQGYDAVVSTRSPHASAIAKASRTI